MSKTARRCTARLRSKRGMASALIIMLLVLLVFFGILSLVTTAADLRLSQKRAEWNTGFYQADAAAVQLIAGLDTYCRGLDEDSLQANKLEPLLKTRLDAEVNVLEYSLVQGNFAAAPLILSARVAGGADQVQGIDLQIRILTGAINADRIEIEKWVQWQPAFEYGSGPADIWKG